LPLLKFQPSYFQFQYFFLWWSLHPLCIRSITSTHSIGVYQ